jgi:hypothetical protein
MASSGKVLHCNCVSLQHLRSNLLNQSANRVMEISLDFPWSKCPSRTISAVMAAGFLMQIAL